MLTQSQALAVRQARFTHSRIIRWLSSRDWQSGVAAVQVRAFRLALRLLRDRVRHVREQVA